MENKKKSVIYIFLILIFFIGCKKNVHTQIALGNKPNKKIDTIRCKNDSSLYSEIVSGLLYKDSVSNIYLRRKKVMQKSPLGGKLSKCEKLPYGYIDVMGILNDSIVNIKDIIDIKSFKRFSQTDIFYADNNKVYVFQDSPVTFPQFFEINIDVEKVNIVDSLYIKDSKNVYWKGIKVQDVDAISLKKTTINTKDGEYISLVSDKKHLYLFNKKYNLEQLKNLPFSEKKIDSLQSIFFK
ncbi:MAG: DKNYY domain-containing protein [Flavobacteriaceae bacterium]|nr:DKNYY domain-containing protein [Flavobacteriaceae bacterium]